MATSATTQPSQAPSSSEEGVGGGGSHRARLLDYASQMRINPTEPEKRLWMQLRASRLGGHKFRRQATIGNRIVDFFCPAKGAIIEVDGDTHDHDADAHSDAILTAETGFLILRFTNQEVMRNLDGVLLVIANALAVAPDRWEGSGRHHPPTPSSEEEGEF